MKPLREALRAGPAVLAVLAVVALLTAACGIQPTGVVSAGIAPAMAGSGSADSNLALYFLRDGVQMAPVQRPWPSAKKTLDLALHLLFIGPNGNESERGYTSGLPREIGSSSVVRPGDGSVVVSLAYPVGELRDAGKNQIVCTTAAAVGSIDAHSGTAMPSPFSGQITLIGSDGDKYESLCGLG
ncbi:hypothetical protein [Amycolatopsis sp. PS_44_ISF1]|uniref:hypothetical protein n=1 Tax=Amycolatopsis sp. PS_44_ISF1 TaxID=2974917 RepID=UPI0028E069B3|nr:hypothetical protein [Amycolatopsis sp. PS_44_ISF1]MDT8914916.1 hypothetical protein [Amycolatopsis sp. PS_44_ISF1]